MDEQNNKGTLLKIRNVSKKYDDVQILDNISLDVWQGDVIVLLGESGVGKTTLLRIISSLESTDSGSIHFTKTDLGKNLVDATLVFQDFNLWRNKTVAENIILAPTLMGADKGCAKERARMLLKKFGLADKENTYPDFLSGGQKQRVTLLRAIMVRPKVLLLDEVTSSLDTELVDSVQNLVHELANSGYAMVVVSHDIQFAKSIATVAYKIEHGKLREIKL